MDSRPGRRVMSGPEEDALDLLEGIRDGARRVLEQAGLQAGRLGAGPERDLYERLAAELGQ